MHSFLRMRNALWVGLCAVALSAMVSGAAEAKPRPGNPHKGFRLFARPLGALVINRIYCGLNSDGEICVDSTNSSTIGGGFWPKGTADQYVFNSGIQVAGIIGPDANPEWQGDTTGAQLFSPRGDNVGEEVRPIFNASNPDDVANWPEAALVPTGDASQELFDPLLRGRVSASQGDVWFLSWDGNPAFSAGRPHPLGVLVEQRGLGYNFPSGNEDILYFIYTFYNVTSKDPAAYATVRPGMKDILAEQGARFQTLNESRFGITIPDGGYTINNMFAAFGADMDVAESGANFASVNVPFSLGYTYEHTFSPASGWTFDPSIFSPPFFSGSGFVGVKYLKSPVVNGQEVGLTLFSNTINQGAFDDAQNTTQLYRYLSNNINTAAGDAACNTGDPRATKICYINNGQEDDMRFFQASGPLTLKPGEFGSIVVAYIFAAPRSVGPCTGPGTCTVKPGDPTRLSDAVRLSTEGANLVDSVSGFNGLRGTYAAGDTVFQDSISTIPGSLLGKALVAQEVFRNKFLLPFAPETPNFFLIPGDNQTTVFWQPSSTEANGDPFFAIANVPTTPEGAINTLYDPNYRKLDVEGYRVYRGRVDSPNSLQLLAQFDYSGTVISDFQGQVNPVPLCAPELAPPLTGCPKPFTPATPGVGRTIHLDVPLVGPIVQVKLGERAALATNEAILLKSDTAVVGAASGCRTFGAPAECDLKDSGVPFVYVDRTARNNLRYFYAVTAFDVNSFQSGPSSLESPRVTKSTVPVAPAGNFASTGTTTTRLEGRAVVINQDTTLPSIDPVTGIFSKKFPPANNASLEFVGEFVKTIFGAPGEFSAKLVGLGLGDARTVPITPVNYTWEGTATTGQKTIFNILVPQPLTGRNQNTITVGPAFAAALADDQLSSRFGIPAGFVAAGLVRQGVVGYTAVNAFGRGAFDASIRPATGTTGVLYNGPRWFQGDNETKADPNGANNADLDLGEPAPSGPNNAGELPGIATIQTPLSYVQIDGGGRALEAVTSGAIRAADFKVYWGAAGLVDSVIDVTHNVVVPFMADSVGGGWGFLNQAAGAAGGSLDARPAVLTLADFGCVRPLKTLAGSKGYLPCTAATPYVLSATAVPGPVAIFTTPGSKTTATEAPIAPPAANPGFAMWLAGHIFMFELAPAAAVPATGTVWTLRNYIGWVSGGNGAGGSLGPYKFTPRPRTFSAIGAELKLSFSASNLINATVANDLTKVHTVPDPYYVTSAFEQTSDTKVIKFVNLPNDCIVRIYSSSGVLVSLIEHHSTTFGGSEDWNVRNRNNQVVASGVYFYHVESGGARRVGRFTVVNFAQ